MRLMVALSCSRRVAAHAFTVVPAVARVADLRRVGHAAADPALGRRRQPAEEAQVAPLHQRLELSSQARLRPAKLPNLQYSESHQSQEPYEITMLLIP